MNKKLLVVDDDNDLLEALRTALSQAGHTVDTARDGNEGLAKALALQPDLILLDIWMPHMNGHEMLHELRKDAWGKTARVIMLTNADDATNISLGVGNKSGEYIIKSQTSLASILKKVTQHLAGYHD